jgi:hypothetical protein
MDGRNEQRVAIRFCFKADLSAIETLVLMEKAYGKEDDERSGRPKSTRTEVKIAAVADLVKKDRRIATKMIAELLNIPRTVVLQVLKEDLGKRKLCTSFVPHSLTPEQREDRVTSCQDIIAMADADKNFFNKIITRDETWSFAYDPETKRQISEWVGETSPLPEKLKFQSPASRPRR